MKTTIKTLALAATVQLAALATSNAQTTRPTLTVLSVDAKRVNAGTTSEQMGNLVRIELEKIDVFEVMDRYDVAYRVAKNKVQIDNCFGKICLAEIGDIIHSDKMLSGSIEKYPKSIIYTLRLIDVKVKAYKKLRYWSSSTCPKNYKV